MVDAGEKVRTSNRADCFGCLAEVFPAETAVVGVAEGDAEVGVVAGAGVSVVVAEGDDETAAGKLERVGVVDVVGVADLEVVGA